MEPLQTEVWYPLITPILKKEWPNWWDFVILTNGRTIWIGQAEYSPPKEVMVLQVKTANGPIPAYLLDVSHFIVLQFPEWAIGNKKLENPLAEAYWSQQSGIDQPADQDGIDHLIASLSEGLVGKTDSELLALRTSWSELAATRKAGLVPGHLPVPYDTLPALVWEKCVENVTAEIERRMSGDGPATRAAQELIIKNGFGMELTVNPDAVEKTQGVDLAHPKTFRDEWPLAPGSFKLSAKMSIQHNNDLKWWEQAALDEAFELIHQPMKPLTLAELLDELMRGWENRVHLLWLERNGEAFKPVEFSIIDEVLHIESLRTPLATISLTGKERVDV